MSPERMGICRFDDDDDDDRNRTRRKKDRKESVEREIEPRTRVCLSGAALRRRRRLTPVFLSLKAVARFSLGTRRRRRRRRRFAPKKEEWKRPTTSFFSLGSFFFSLFLSFFLSFFLSSRGSLLLCVWKRERKKEREKENRNAHKSHCSNKLLPQTAAIGWMATQNHPYTYTLTHCCPSSCRIFLDIHIHMYLYIIQKSLDLVFISALWFLISIRYTKLRLFNAKLPFGHYIVYIKLRLYVELRFVKLRVYCT